MVIGNNGFEGLEWGECYLSDVARGSIEKLVGRRQFDLVMDDGGKANPNDSSNLYEWY